jgi:heat shock protein HtpX
MTSSEEHQLRFKARTFLGPLGVMMLVVVLPLMIMLPMAFFNTKIGFIMLNVIVVLITCWPLAGLILIKLVYWWSDSLVLTLPGTKLIEHNDNQILYNVVTEMSIAANLPVPRIIVVDDSVPNAFVIGRDPEHVVIVFTSGIIDKMNRDELQSIAAHEMAHIKEPSKMPFKKMVITSYVVMLASDIFWRKAFIEEDRKSKNSSTTLLLMAITARIVTPFAAILYPFISSSINNSAREKLVDTKAITYTRNPLGLQNALLKLQAPSTLPALPHDRFVTEPPTAFGNLCYCLPAQDRIDALGAL